MAFFDERVEKGIVAKLQGIVDSEFVRMSYGEAISILERANEKFEFPVKWGLDLQSEHERYLTEQHAKKPVIVMNYPKEIKAFYMRSNDDGKTVAAMDVLAPGIGEIVGGSQREERLEFPRRAHGRSRHRQREPRLVPRPAPLRHRAARRLRPGLRAHRVLRHRAFQRARRHSVSPHAGQRQVLTLLRPAAPADALGAETLRLEMRSASARICQETQRSTGD